ncbi:MAG: hypothetical protein IE912_03125 [Brevundimonas diminuta]|nr:hypothetical protein [Brevundimonas diminuta]MBD3817893.1 hypothetical protein [Brevundimonas diminuta]
MSRSLFQINADLARLRQEKRDLKRKHYAPVHVRSRSFRPEGPGQRQPRERDNKHLAFIRRLPCVGCTSPGPCDAAHLRAGDLNIGKRPTGKAEKPSDRWTTPLCRDCHTRQHTGAELAFWQALGIDPFDLCQALYAISGDTTAAEQIIQNHRQEAQDHG